MKPAKRHRKILSELEEAANQQRETWKLLGNCRGGIPCTRFRGQTLPVELPLYWETAYNFDFQPDDVLLMSHPKSGTHWTYYIIYLLKTRNFGDIPEIHQMPFLEIPYWRTQLDELSQLPPPRVLTTHLAEPLLPKNAFKAKVLYIYRNAKDVVVSFYHHYLNRKDWPYNDTFEEFVRRFMKGDVHCGPYPEHLKGMLKLKNEGRPMLVLRYEDALENTEQTVRQIAAFLGETVDDELVAKIVQATKFENMKNNKNANGNIWQKGGVWKKNAPFVRRAEVDGWHDYFVDETLLAEFNDYIRDNVPEQLLNDVLSQKE